jgi:hypothetical protein
MVSSFKKRRGTPVPVAGEQKFPARDILAPDGTKGLGHHTRCRARKEKALGPCELKALLRDPVESMHEAQPSTNHMAPPDLAVDDTSYVRR